MTRKVAIIGGKRIPFARSNTAYSEASNQKMLTAALKGTVDGFGLQGLELGEVVGGAVMKHSRDFNLVRESMLDSGLSPSTPACDMQQACATGMQAAIAAGNKIALGQIDSAIACGVDTTSDAPIGVSEGMRKILLKLNRAKTNGQRAQLALKMLNPKLLAPNLPQNGEPRTKMSMGQHAQVTAAQWKVSREDQDQLTAASHQNMAKAYDRGFHGDLVVPFNGLTRDNNLRPESSVEKLAKLSPVFDRENGTMTAGNSTPLTDGASAVLLASEEWAKERGLNVQAFITHSETAAVEFESGKDGLLTAPVFAMPRMLEKAGLTLQDFDFYEIHEAFASQVLATLAAWEDEKFCKERLGLKKALGSIDRSKLNVNGGSLAAGHPFAATGGRLIASLAKALEEKGSGRGLISVCAAGGLGVTMIIER